MVGRLGVNKLLWLLAGFLSFIAAATGVLNPGIYSSIVSTKVMPGVASQDLMTIMTSIIMIILAVLTKQEDAKKQIVILGILGYLFYAYGIYVIEQFYNVLYFLYIAIFTLSFYSIVYGLANIRREITQIVQLPNLTRKIAVGFALLIPALFYALWISQLVPLIQAGEKIEFTYSVYILDMCFVFPAFAIIAFMAAQKQGLGLLLIPVIFIKGFTLLFSVALGEVFKPLYNQAVNAGEIWLYLGVSTVFLGLAVVYLWNLKIPRLASIMEVPHGKNKLG